MALFYCDYLIANMLFWFVTMHVHVLIHAKHLTLLFSTFRIWQSLMPKDKKMERETKKEQPRRISEERV